MNPPESPNPRGAAAASGFDPMPSAFTGQARDFPGPVESMPPAAVAAVPESPPIAMEKSAALPATGLPMVPADTAFRLQALADALAKPAPVLSRKPEPEDLLDGPANFSLSALADQLHERFSKTDSTGGGEETADLLDDFPASSAPDTRRPRNPLQASGAPVPGGLSALLPSLGLKPPPPPPAVPSAAPGSGFLNPPASGKPGLVRQGDVFFMEPPAPEARPADLHAADNKDAKPAPPLHSMLFEGDSGAAEDLLDAPGPAPFLEDPRPLLFHAPAHAIAAPSPPPLPPSARAADASEAGLGLILGGTGLILLGIFLACLLPLDWLAMSVSNADDWGRQKAGTALILHAAAALTALSLGAGSVFQRRWAPPLIHAAGWVAALTATGLIAVTGFYLVREEAEAGLPVGPTVTLLLAALLLPLAYIFYYERAATLAACETADPAPSWTDGLPVPALMVFLTGLGLAAGAGAMLCHQPVLPLPGTTWLTGPEAMTSWIGLSVLGLAIAVCVVFRKSAAVWLLLLAALFLAATLSPPALAGAEVWDTFVRALGRPSPAGSSPLIPLLAALLPAPLLLIFAMARRAFPSPPPP